MKATGIVRRIDDLGRVVIPKEIRRTLRIREGDPLEIFVDRDGEVILKKYSPISELGDFATEYAEALFDSLDLSVLISDRDEYIAVAGESKKDYLGKHISKKIDKLMDSRESVIETSKSTIEIIENKEEELEAYLLQPIVAGGDPIGCMVLFTKEKREFGDAEKKSAQTAATFLAKQME
ncbi:stage V sporulation protein T [Gracilibacillus kekensis]|uniref:AbrB family transcriptional regulator, stage V sporulation protein T n=1 Tax=Gracilibacillus kekensis TaxID=1027249 RepID=A0A1M7QZE2_9BACI|nr:stage V sporulation protein T [Gracilibacillus kekensis]SHN37492.1 AbrB family transcriptional regulator, stage V sporulation protein T [Gracilibacillus kekensis]